MRGFSRLFELLEQIFQLSISTNQMIDQHAHTVGDDVQKPPVRTSASGRWPAVVAGPVRPPLSQRAGLGNRATSRASSARLFGHGDILQTGHHLQRQPRDTRFLVRSHSGRALGVWRRGQTSSNLGSYHGPLWDVVRDRALCQHQLRTTASAIHPENCESTRPGGSPQKVI